MMVDVTKKERNEKKENEGRNAKNNAILQNNLRDHQWGHLFQGNVCDILRIDGGCEYER